MNSNIDRYPGETEDILKKISESGGDDEKDSYFFNRFNTLCSDFLDEKQKITLVDIGFWGAPASTKYHGANRSGLLRHSVSVADELIKLTKNLNLTWSRPESPIIVGLLHDLCKVDQYNWNHEKQAYEWNNDPVVKGHGMKSVIYIQRYLGLKLTDEEIACIVYHMGAFCPEKEWNDYTTAVNKYPNVLYTHTADMIATHINNM